MADESRSNPIREDRFSWDNPNDIEVIKVGKQPPTPKAKPPGDSQEQQDAQGVMIAAFGETRGVDLKSETVSLGDGVTVKSTAWRPTARCSVKPSPTKARYEAASQTRWSVTLLSWHSYLVAGRKQS